MTLEGLLTRHPGMLSARGPQIGDQDEQPGTDEIEFRLQPVSAGPDLGAVRALVDPALAALGPLEVLDGAGQVDVGPVDAAVAQGLVGPARPARRMDVPACPPGLQAARPPGPSPRSSCPPRTLSPSRARRGPNACTSLRSPLVLVRSSRRTSTRLSLIPRELALPDLRVALVIEPDHQLRAVGLSVGARCPVEPDVVGDVVVAGLGLTRDPISSHSS